MGSNLEALAPLLAATPSRESPLNLDDVEGMGRLRNALTAIAAPDLECAMIGPDPVVRTEWEGIEGFLDAWADWLSPYKSFHLEVDEVIESGEHVVTLARQCVTLTEGGPQIETAAAAVWSFRDGKLARVEFHLDRDAALRVAGLAG